MNREEIQEWLEALKADTTKANQALASLSSDGESIGDILRHDKGHDDWHASHGDPPCKSEEDCSAMSAKYKDEEAAKGGPGSGPRKGSAQRRATNDLRQNQRLNDLRREQGNQTSSHEGAALVHSATASEHASEAQAHQNEAIQLARKGTEALRVGKNGQATDFLRRSGLHAEAANQHSQAYDDHRSAADDHAVATTGNNGALEDMARLSSENAQASSANAAAASRSAKS